MLTGFVSVSTQDHQTFYGNVDGQHSQQEILDSAHDAALAKGLDLEFVSVQNSFMSAAVDQSTTLELDFSAEDDFAFTSDDLAVVGRTPTIEDDDQSVQSSDDDSDSSEGWTDDESSTPRQKMDLKAELGLAADDMEEIIDTKDDGKSQKHTIPPYSEQRSGIGSSGISKMSVDNDTLMFGLSHDNDASRVETQHRKEAYAEGTAAIEKMAQFSGYDLSSGGALSASGIDALIKEYQSDEHVVSGAIHAQRYGGITDRIPENIINEDVVSFLKDKVGDDSGYPQAMQDNHFSLKSVAQRCQGAILKHISEGKPFIYHLDGLDPKGLQTIAAGPIDDSGSSVTDLELNFLARNWDSEVFDVAINSDTVKFMLAGSEVESPFAH